MTRRSLEADIRLVESRAVFGDDLRRQFRTGAGDNVDLNPELFIESLRQSRSHLRGSVEIDGQLAFFLGGCNGLLPLRLPLGAGIAEKDESEGQRC